jgi:hypothetical protein
VQALQEGGMFGARIAFWPSRPQADIDFIEGRFDLVSL